MKRQLDENTFNRWQKLAGLQSLNENENVEEGFLDKLKSIFAKTKYTYTGKNEEYGYAYFSDDKGNKYIGMTIINMLPDEGYRTRVTNLWPIEDEDKIKQAKTNEKLQNRKYQGTKLDPYRFDGDHQLEKIGDYYPKPFKVVNKSTF
jgi:hypothetical protein